MDVGIPTVAIRENQGRVCYVCLRVFQARYESRGLTLSRLESDMGNKQEVHPEFSDSMRGATASGWLLVVSRPLLTGACPLFL